MSDAFVFMRSKSSDAAQRIDLLLAPANELEAAELAAVRLRAGRPRSFSMRPSDCICP